MRVLHVTSTFPRADGDTTGPFLADLVAAQRDAGIDVSVLAPHAPGVSSSVEGVPVRRFRYGPVRLERLAYGPGLLAVGRTASGSAMIPAYLAAMAAATRAEVRRLRPDVVHAHWWLPGGLAAALQPTPFVLTLHGSDVAIAPRLRRLARWVLSRAAAVVAVSDALAEEAAQTIGGPAVGVAPMPVVIAPASMPGPPRSGLLAVGRLTPEKGFDVLIDAMARIRPDTTLDVIGDGPLMAGLRARATDRVRFLGALPRAEYHARLRAASALVVPSRREGLGLVAVEAILAGTPVVASAVGGLPSVVCADGGILVPPDDAVALAHALDHVSSLLPPGPLALAAAARHEPAAVVRAHLALYEQAAGSLRGS
ncbi:MAG: glycosyltransferase [Acidimicrobiales bacterium]